MPWDQILVFLIVAAAAVYLVWLQRRKKSGCGGCSQACGTPARTGEPASPAAEELVQIDASPRPRVRP
ncbi:MAG: FeoB-associated Cys-rich membrane protein [Armatimonadota bacterium]